MTEQIVELVYVDQLLDYVGRDVEVVFRGKVLTAKDTPVVLVNETSPEGFGLSILKQARSIGLLPVPPPEEPKGIGAVVRVKPPGERAFIVVRIGDGAYPFYDVYLASQDWASLVNRGTCTVLSPGVEVSE